MTRRWLIFKIMVCAFGGGFALGVFPSASFADDLAAYCLNAWTETEACPAHRCYLDCAGGLQFEGCQQTCKPKPCFQIDAEHCPLEFCDVVEGCGEISRCYPRIRRGEGLCGDLAYPGQDIECCSGMIRRCGVEFFDGTCDMIGKNSVYGVPVCLPCGNGICNQFENSCNCPEDCARFPAPAGKVPDVRPVSDPAPEPQPQSEAGEL